MYDFEKLLKRNENGSKKWNVKYIRERFGVDLEKTFILCLLLIWILDCQKIY